MQARCALISIHLRRTLPCGAGPREAQAGRAGALSLAQVEAELETALQTAFSNQPEVVGKLKEAIEFYEEDAAARSGKR